MAIVDRLVDERHLQKGIARIQLPCSMVSSLKLSGFTSWVSSRMENRITGYYNRPDKSLTLQKVASNAKWEFGFDDAFVIQLPADLLEKSTEKKGKAHCRRSPQSTLMQVSEAGPAFKLDTHPSHIWAGHPTGTARKPSIVASWG